MSTLATTECEKCPVSAEPAAGPAVLNMPFGLLGFEEVKQYLVLGNPDEHPFMWLQMTEAPKQAFLVVPPSAVVGDYRPELSDEDVAFLGLESPEDAVIVNIVTLRSGGTSTVNLKGPIVFNRHTRIGKQVIPLNASRFTLQHPLPALD
ncbi:MAG: flagellar assembly protein FliW [Verrucomicrobiales bacterium]|nr:flagellar assembly protein FliW [Verrucomicrobiales bacterium]